VSEDVIATRFGQVVVTHGPDQCLPPCTIHAPSDHHMVDWPQLWRDDRQIMERICPHGIGHPDPDDLAVRTRAGFGVHGCDGCCTRPPDPRVVIRAEQAR
jgi:hypothetical protein